MSNYDRFIYNPDGSLKIRRRPISDDPRYRVNQQYLSVMIFIVLFGGQKLKRKSLDEIDEELAEIAARWDEVDTGVRWGWRSKK